MDDLSTLERKALAKARELGKPFTPTELGMALGYDQRAASSRVAPALRMLTEVGVLSKTVVRHNLVTYSLNPKSPLA